MDRKEFLAQLGLTSAAIFTGMCMGGCSKDDGGGGGTVTPPPTGVDFTINLSDGANSALLTPGGFLYRNRIIIAFTLSSQYIAVSQACTHQGTTVEFQAAQNRFYCPNHGSIFSTTGAVQTGPAAAPLMQYNVALSGNNLRIFS